MLSIIIPTYQEEKYIGRLLESIKKQTLQPDEIIVADNHSKDRTREIAKAHRCKVVDGGNPAKGRNEGAKVAKSDLLLFLDADNEIKKIDFLEKFVSAFKKRDLDVATSFVTIEKLTPKNFFVNFGFYYAKVANELVLKHFKNITSESGACILVKKELFDAIGQFDESIELCEDDELFARVSKHGAKYGVIPINIRTSDRRFKNMKTKDFILISSSVVVGFFVRFFGIKDSKLVEITKKLYGPLGGQIDEK